MTFRKMKIIAFVFAVLVMPLFLKGADVMVPAKLDAYEDFIARKLDDGFEGAKEGKIRVIVAAGEVDVIDCYEEIEMSADSKLSDVGVLWGKKHQRPLLGWAQGLVIIRRKVSGGVLRFVWTMHEARTEAPKFQMQNGDALIGIMYPDY